MQDRDLVFYLKSVWEAQPEKYKHNDVLLAMKRTVLNSYLAKMHKYHIKYSIAMYLGITCNFQNKKPFQSMVV